MGKVKRTQYHMSVNIEGLLLHFRRKSLAGMFSDNGRDMTDKEAREFLKDCLAKGWVEIPMCEWSKCPDFDFFGGGCPGHEIKEGKYQ